MANFPPVGAPRAEKWERLPDKWPVVQGPEFQDGGIDTFLSGSAPVRRWQVIYTGLTNASAQVLDDWYAANQGEHLSFTFTDRDSTVYGAVKVETYERGHRGRYAVSGFRRIVFVDRP